MSSSLNSQEWCEFFLKEIFHNVQRGKRLTRSNQIKGIKPYISSTASNNGVDNFIGNDSKIRSFSNCLTIANSGSVGATFYHPYEFVASDHITHLKNNNLKASSYLFIATQTSRFSQKYNFNREINDKRISREKIILPSNKKKSPDWDYIDQYINILINKKRTEYINFSRRILERISYKEIQAFEEKDWGEFFIEEIAEIHSGQDIYDAERFAGKIPYISSTSQNNGISHFIGNTNKTLEENCISVNRNGSVGYSFYHPYKGLFSNDCRKLKPKYISRYVGFFIANQITRQKEKYNYGYKMGTGRLKRQKIMLPINHNNQPDYDYMEQYMINLEIMKRKQYLAYIEAQQESL